MPRGLEVSLPEELQPAVLEPALVVDWLARWVELNVVIIVLLLLWVELNGHDHPPHLNRWSEELFTETK